MRPDRWLSCVVIAHPAWHVDGEMEDGKHAVQHQHGQFIVNLASATCSTRSFFTELRGRYMSPPSLAASREHGDPGLPRGRGCSSMPKP